MKVINFDKAARNDFSPKFKIDNFIYIENNYKRMPQNSFYSKYDSYSIEASKLWNKSSKIINDWFYLNKDNNFTIFYNSTNAINYLSKHIKIKYSDKRIILISSNSHISNYFSWKNSGFDVYVLNEKNYEKKLEDIEIEKVGAFSFSTNSNLDGSEYDYKKIISYLNSKNKSYLKIADVNQSVSHKRIDFSKSNFDFMIFSSSKFFAGPGCSFIFSKNKNIVFGSKKIKEHKKVVGTQNLFNIYNQARYIQNFLLDFDNVVVKKEKELMNFFLEGAKKNKRINILNKNTKIPIFLVSLSDIEDSVTSNYLNKMNIWHTFSDCCNIETKDKYKKNMVIRVSLDWNNTQAEIKKFFEILSKDKDQILTESF